MCSCVESCRQAGTLDDNFRSRCTSPAHLEATAFHMSSKCRSRKVPHCRDSPTSLNRDHRPNTFHDAASSPQSKRILSIAICHSLALASQPVTAVRMLQPRTFLLCHPSFSETHLTSPPFNPKTFTCFPKRSRVVDRFPDKNLGVPPAVLELQSLTPPLNSPPPRPFFFTIVLRSSSSSSDKYSNHLHTLEKSTG